MQTFLPYPSFAQSASILDRQRLGKQRSEAKQILTALSDQSYGWQNHPAVRMWRGHRWALTVYGIMICNEWQTRGYKDTLLDYFREQNQKIAYTVGENYAFPRWLGDKNFHRSHQSNLLRKDHEYYFRFFPDVPNNLPYVWPV